MTDIVLPRMCCGTCSFWMRERGAIGDCLHDENLRTNDDGSRYSAGVTTDMQVRSKWEAR